MARREWASRRTLPAHALRLQDLGIPPECVPLRLHELPAQNFGVRGGQALCDVESGCPVAV
ncbi:MAG: hypothetical protein KF683_07005 [Rubrivivax sp.]|nr:hypothetical protein [Rubrivivax sp.]